MPSTTRFTYEEVAKHVGRKDMYMVIHDKVYNLSSFLDEHPGGEEALFELAGRDATDAFEDVGHSDEARGLLGKMLIGDLERVAGDDAPIRGSTAPASGGSNFILYLLTSIILVVACYGYQYSQDQDNWDTVVRLWTEASISLQKYGTEKLSTA